MEHPSSSPEPPLVHWALFWRALIAPLAVWGVLVSGALLTHQPGVVCITPMAWLLALWSGARYVMLLDGPPDRYPLLAPAAIGAALGLGQGIIFIIVIAADMPAATPDDLARTRLLSVVMVAGGILVCAALAAFIAWLRLHRFPRER